MNKQHIRHSQQGWSKPLCVVQAPLVIHTPHALPMFKEAKQIRKRKSERDHDDAVKFHKPEVGSSAATLGRGAAGLIGKTGGTLLTQYILKNHVSPLTLLACAVPQESCKSPNFACMCCVTLCTFAVAVVKVACLVRSFQKHWVSQNFLKA